MTNEIHPFSIDLSIDKAIELSVFKLGKSDIIVKHFSSDTNYYLIDILSNTQSLCKYEKQYVIFLNIDLYIPTAVVLYDEVKALKFVEQTKLFEDGK